jgi:hypothetical protein
VSFSEGACTECQKSSALRLRVRKQNHERDAYERGSSIRAGRKASKQPDAGLPDDPTDDDRRNHNDQQQRGHEDETRLHIAKLSPVCRGKGDPAELAERPFPFGNVQRISTLCVDPTAVFTIAPRAKTERGRVMPEANRQAEARWAKAATRADGLMDLGVGAAVRRYFSVNFPLTVLVALGVGFAVATVWPIGNDFLQSGFYLGLILAGLGIFVVGLVYGNKKVHPMVQPQRIGVTVGLTAEEVKHVRRQVLAKEPIDADRLPVLRGAAVQIREGLAKQLLTAPGLVIFFIGQTLYRGITSVIDMVMIVLLLCMIALFINGARQFQQTGAFLTSAAPTASDGKRHES